MSSSSWSSGGNLRERRSFALTAAILTDHSSAGQVRLSLGTVTPLFFALLPDVLDRLGEFLIGQGWHPFHREGGGNASRRQAVRRVERRLLCQSFRFARLRVAASLDDLRGLKARTIRTMDEVARTWWMIRSGLRDPVFCQAGVGREGAMVLTLSARRRIMPPKIMRWIG